MSFFLEKFVFYFESIDSNHDEILKYVDSIDFWLCRFGSSIYRSMNKNQENVCFRRACGDCSF